MKVILSTFLCFLATTAFAAFEPETKTFTGQDIINLIFAKKEAARFMSKKLWEFFVYENPSQGALDALSASFQKALAGIAPVAFTLTFPS